MIRFKTSLFGRGIVLMSFPILCQLIFIIVIALVMRQAQDTLERQWRSENLLRSTFSICREVSDLFLWLQLPEAFRKMIGLDVSSSWLVSARKDGETLRQLGSDDPDKRESLNRLVESTAYMFDLLEQMLSKPSSGPAMPWGYGASPANRSALRSYGQVFYASVEDIVGIEKRKDENDDLYTKAFANVQYGLFSVALVSILLAACAGYVYTISIRRPLKHLTENGELLAAQRPLLPVLKASDEFSEIDTLLHTASREIEATLLKEQEVIENAQDMICTVDAGGVFLSANPYVDRMLGYHQDFVTTTPVSNYVVETQKSLVAQFFNTAVSAQAVHQFDLDLMNLQGGVVETRWACLWSAAEKKLFCVVRDVTEEKRTERLKQDFADMISHDLRSPLMAMGNALTLIKAGIKGEVPDKAMVRIETSSRNVEKLIMLVNDLLDFQKLKAGKMELSLQDVAIETVIADAAGLVEEAARDKNVELVLPSGVTTLRGDRSKLMQLVVNLISNAIKFSGKGGQVAVAINTTGESVHLSVIDSGPGVSPEFLERIFEPFEQAPSEKKKEGTGLGLAICKLVVEAHGGQISARNRQDEPGMSESTTGGIFSVVLPRKGPQSED